MTFKLHPQLKQDCILIGRFELCQLLLMNDRQFPWFILVPELTGLSEIHHLSRDDRIQFMDESCYLAENLAEMYKADKINVASLGNMVPQLHIHHIVRYRSDMAWPAPVWGAQGATPYTDQEILENIILLKAGLKRCQFSEN